MKRKILTAVSMTFAAFVLFANTASAQPTSTTEKIKGAGAVTTQELKGKVVFVEGNDLVVQLANGDIRTFRVPESRRFVVDGKEVSVHELKVGTQLHATVTTTTTPVTVRTTTVGSGTVWYVAGNNVILTLPNNENRQYIVKPDVKFTVNGQPATVFDLKKGMVVSAEKIVEEPMTEIATDTRITGTGPGAVASTTTTTKSADAASSSSADAAAPAKLPKTASALPLVGLLGAACFLTGLALTARRRQAAR